MKRMKLLAAMALSMTVAGTASADLVMPSLEYRTGPYAPNGIHFADGYTDYFTLLNERDGGIGGVPVRVIPCETAYNTEKGVECYESTKGEGALVYPVEGISLYKALQALYSQCELPKGERPLC